MDWKERLLDVGPHYIALLFLIFLVLAIVQTFIGDLGFWIELLIAVGIAFAYPPAVRRLDIAPESWENR